MLLKQNTILYGVSDNPLNKDITTFIVRNKYLNNTQIDEYKIMNEITKGIYIARGLPQDTFLKTKHFVLFTNENDAIKYHNMVVEDAIDNFREKYTIKERNKNERKS